MKIIPRSLWSSITEGKRVGRGRGGAKEDRKRGKKKRNPNGRGYGSGISVYVFVMHIAKRIASVNKTNYQCCGFVCFQHRALRISLLGFSWKMSLYHSFFFLLERTLLNSLQTNRKERALFFFFFFYGNRTGKRINGLDRFNFDP